MTEQQMRRALTRYIKEHKGYKLTAKSFGISIGYLSDIIRGRRINPPDSVLNALGLERVVMYRRAKAPVSR